MTNTIQFIASFIIIIVFSFLFKFGYEKIKIKDFVKKIILGVLYGIIAIACSYLSLKTQNGNFISLANSAVIFGGVLFGGSVGLVAGVISALVSFLTVGIKTAGLAIILGLVFAGITSFVFHNLVNENKKFKWYFAIIASIITESFSALCLFLTNMQDLKLAYDIANDTVVLRFSFNILVIVLGILLIAITSLNKSKIERPLSIQTKMQIRLAIVIVIGFVISMASIYGILTNISNESTKSTIALSVDDIKTNIDDDIKTEVKAQYAKTNQALKTSLVMTFPDSETLLNFAEKTGYTNLSIIEKDGTIYCSSDSYISNLSNLSQFESFTVRPGPEDTIVTDFGYVPEKDGYFQFYVQQYKFGSDDKFVIVEINEKRYNELINDSLTKGIAARHLGETGYIFVSDKENNIVSTPIELEETTVDLDGSKNEVLSIIEIDDNPYYAYFSDYCDYTIIGLMEKTSTDINKNTSIYITSFATILVFSLLYFVIYYSIKSQVIKPLIKVNATLDKICDGKLDEKVSETGSKELKTLSEDINSTVDALKEYMGREAKLIQKDLNFAKSIQLSALPTDFPVNEKFELYATMDTAKEVGGDFYDFYFVDNDHLCILIADVSGKGVPAALFMMQSKTIIKSYIEAGLPLEDAFNIANKKLCQVNNAGMFVTVWCGILDLNTGVLDYINAGHNQPLIKNTDEYKFLECKPGFVFGAVDMVKYRLQTVKLEKGAEIYLYTDGVCEATAVSEELYGNDRMVACANSMKSVSSKEFCENMLGDVKSFVLEAEQSDDITQLHVKYYG